VRDREDVWVAGRFHLRVLRVARPAGLGDRA
jgi:hypothetical protein